MCVCLCVCVCWREDEMHEFYKWLVNVWLSGVSFFVLLFVCFVFLGPQPWHMEVPSLGAESELLCRPVPQLQQRRV